jgi:hypothetical protein
MNLRLIIAHPPPDFHNRSDYLFNFLDLTHFEPAVIILVFGSTRRAAPIAVCLNLYPTN